MVEIGSPGFGDPLKNAESATGVQEDLKVDADRKEQLIQEAIRELQAGPLTGELVKDTEEQFWFKHRRIRSFKVGEFEFKNHVIKVARSKLPSFLEAIKGCRPIDTNNIVHIKHIENEQTLDSFQDRVMRGAADTARIPDPVKNQPAKEIKTGDTGALLAGLKPKT